MCAGGETGLQFLGRLSTRPTLDDLDRTLFPDGIKPKEVVELSGDTNCGKTLLLTQLIVKCILPKTYENVKLDGLDCGVLFINADHHFVIFKLTELLEQHILSKCKLNSDDHQSGSLSSTSVENIIKYSLKNLLILNIFDGVQLKITVHTIKQLMADNPKVSLVVFDSAVSNYWQDIESEQLFGNIKKMDVYLKNVVKLIQSNTMDFNTCFIYTRPLYFKTKQTQPDPVPGLGNVTRKIILKSIKILSGTMMHQCKVITSSNSITKFYTIESSGLKWTSEESNK